MDVAYDHIQDDLTSPDKEGAAVSLSPTADGGSSNLNTELQEAYKNFTSSQWGAKIGGFFGAVRKQGEQYYQEAQKEYATASNEASKGLASLQSTLANRTRSLSFELASARDPTAATPDNPRTVDEQEAIAKAAAEEKANAASKENVEQPESLPADIVKEATSMVSRFRDEATKRLRDIEKAEDAADQALLKFGSNIRNFLREAVQIAPPSDEEAAVRQSGGGSRVLFESKDSDGRKVIHTSRFDAQLHVIHCNLDSFTRDPASQEYEKWKEEFDVQKKTDAIAADLEKYEELRRAMEKLVPEKMEYALFWTRYYFLRHVIETEEAKRREMLKGAGVDEEEDIGWGDDDSDNDEATSTTPRTAAEKAKLTSPSAATLKAPSTSTTTADPTTTAGAGAETRKSQDEQSRTDSDTSYDIVSGAASAAPGSPKEENKKTPAAGTTTAAAGEESEEEDWE